MKNIYELIGIYDTKYFVLFLSSVMIFHLYIGARAETVPLFKCSYKTVDIIVAYRVYS